MKRLALVLLVVVGLLFPACFGEAYPRHIDPSVLGVEEPDPEMLFLLFHEIYLGMITRDFKVSKEWLNWALEILTLRDLEKLLLEYGDLLNIQVDNMNFTSYYFQEALRAVSQLQIARARAMLVQGLVFLEVSGSTMPELYGMTSALERMVRARPQVLYDDLVLLDQQIQEYWELAELIGKFLETGELTQDDIDSILEQIRNIISDGQYNVFFEQRIKELLRDLFERGELTQEDLDFILEQMKNILSDAEYDGFLDQYIKEFFKDPQAIGALEAPSLTLEVNQTRVVIGQYVMVSGILGLDDDASGRGIRLVLNGKNVGSVYTGLGGYYGYDLMIPFVYRDVGLLWAEYWPEGDDVRRYLPAMSNVVKLDLVHYVPELVVEVQGPALPGESFVVGGLVSYGGAPLEAGVSASFLGVNASAVSLADGRFWVGLAVPPDAKVGVYELAVRTHPRGVYGSAWVAVPVEVVRFGVEIDAYCSGVVLSGMVLRAAGRVSANGVPLDGCVVRLVWGGKVASAVSVDGGFDVGVGVPFWASSEVSGVRVEAYPREAYVDGGALVLETRVVNTGFLVGVLAVSGSVVYFVSRRRPRRVDRGAPVLGVVEAVEPEPPRVDDASSVYMGALLVVQRLTGYVMRSSETVREYLGRVKGGLEERVYAVFEEVSLVYDRWLYGRPFELSLEWFRSLIEGLRSRGDEE